MEKHLVVTVNHYNIHLIDLYSPTRNNSPVVVLRACIEVAFWFCMASHGYMSCLPVGLLLWSTVL